MHDDLEQTGLWLGRVMQGWLGYYAVPTSIRTLSRFRIELMRAWRWTLRRRSQQDYLTWRRIVALSDRYIPPARILHPWPEARFAVKHSS